MVGQLVMDWDNSTDVAARIADASMLTGDREWDALVAGVVEDIAYRHCAKVPSWTMEPERFTDDRWWFLTSSRRCTPLPLWRPRHRWLIAVCSFAAPHW